MADNRAKLSPFYTRIKPVIGHPLVQSFAPIIFNLVFIAVFTVFAIRPTISTITNLQKSIVENQHTLDGLNKKAQDLAQGKKNLENIDPSKRNKINQALPNQPAVPALINDLQNSFINQASISGLQIQPLTLYDLSNNQKNLTSPGEVDFSFNLQGSYSQHLAVLNNLKSSPRIVSLNAITLSKQPQSNVVNMSITGKAYFLK